MSHTKILTTDDLVREAAKHPGAVRRSTTRSETVTAPDPAAALREAVERLRYFVAGQSMSYHALLPHIRTVLDELARLEKEEARLRDAVMRLSMYVQPNETIARLRAELEELKDENHGLRARNTNLQEDWNQRGGPAEIALAALRQRIEGAQQAWAEYEGNELIDVWRQKGTPEHPAVTVLILRADPAEGT